MKIKIKNINKRGRNEGVVINIVLVIANPFFLPQRMFNSTQLCNLFGCTEKFILYTEPQVRVLNSKRWPFYFKKKTLLLLTFFFFK